MHKLSVLMPVKNGERFILESLVRIKESIRQDDEVLVIDDSSSDMTASILNSSVPNFPQLRVIRNPNPGLVNALNLGLNEASNPWIARFDVDDEYPSSRLENQRAIISSSNVGIFSDYSIWSERKDFLGLIPSPVLPLATGISIIQSQRTAHPSVIFNREAVLVAGGYRAEDFPAEDVSLWLRLLRVGDLVSSPRDLLHYRLSSTSVSGSNYRLAKEKTRMLSLSLRLPNGFLSEAIMRCEANLESYSLMSDSIQRQILHLKEMRYAIAMFGCSKNEGAQLRKCFRDVFSSVSPYLKTIELGYWKFKRNQVQAKSRSRNSLLKSN